MLKKMMIVGMALFFAAGVTTPGARAADDHGGFGETLFSDKTPDGFKDPANASTDADAAAAAAMEPAAGGNNPFAATQGTEDRVDKKTAPVTPPPPSAVDGKKDSADAGAR